MGVFVPARTPAAIVDRLNAEIVRIVRDPGVRDVLLAQGVEAAGLAVAEFERFLEVEGQRYGRIARERNIRPEE
jgi:tripartite-type tricarboxylate transporter receptor subunit TctC